MKTRIKRLTLAVCVCAGLVAGVSVALAAVGDGGVITSCYNKNKAIWRPISLSNPTESCKSGEQMLQTYSKSGADNAFLGKTAKAADSDLLDGIDSTGFLGATAKAADSDLLDGKDSSAFVERRWAVVRGDGTVVRSSGGVTAQNSVISGLTFVQINAGSCAISATLGDDNNVDTGADDAPGFITARPGGGEVAVFTYNALGALTDRTFNLVVTC